MKRFFSLFLSCMIGMSWVIAQTEEVKDPLLILDEEMSSGPEKSSEMQWIQTDTYVTTASKKKELVQEAPANITVITASQIKELGANSLAEVLSFMPGITVIETYFGMTNVIFRGNYQELYNNKSLMLVNGHPAWDYANGSYSLEQIPMESVKQIEVIRGPGSVLYGTNAYAGVVNIITYDGSEEGINKVAAKGGSFKTQEYTLAGGAKKDDFNFYAAATSYESDGYEFNVKRDLLGRSGSIDYANEFLSGYLGMQYKELTFTAAYLDQEKQKLGFLPILAMGGPQNYLNWYTDLKWVHPFTDQLTLQVNGRYDKNKKDYEISNGRGGYSNLGLYTNKYGGEVQLTYVPSETFSMTFGGSYDEFKADVDWTRLAVPTALGTYYVTHADETDQDQTDAYANFNWKLMERLSFIAGLRYSTHTVADNTAPNAGLIYQLDDKKFIKFLYGEAFRNPNGYETIVSMLGVINANPNLDSETIKTYDLGFDMVFADRYNLKTNLYYLTTEDTITRGDLNGDRIADYINGEGHKIWGIEVELKMDITSGVNMFINGTLNDGEMRDSGDDVAFLAKETANAGLNWKIVDPFLLSMNVQYIGEREDDNTAYSADSYTLFNLQGIYTINDSWKLTVNATNLFDEEYYYPEVVRQEIGDMGNGPGQAFYGKVEFNY